MKWLTVASICTMILPVKGSFLMSLSHWLVCLFIPAFFLFSCSQNDNIAAPNVGEGDNLRGRVADTFEIQAGTMLRDSLITDAASRLLVGRYDSEDFGEVTCNSFFQTSIVPSNFLTGTNPQFDSMVLVLRPEYLYGNPDALIKMGVHRLKEGFDLESDTTLFSFQTKEFDKTPLAEVSFTAEDISAADLRIRLDTLGREFYDNRNTVKFETAQGFVDFFKGLALVTQVAEGSVIGFNVDPGISNEFANTSGLFIYYRTSEDDNADTTFYRMPISTSFNRFNQIIHNRPSQLKNLKTNNQVLDPVETNGEVFLMAGAGIASKISFPTFTDIKNNHENIIVEQATLLIDGSSSETYYLPPDELFLFKLDSSNNIDFYSGGINLQVGSSARNIQSYSIDVTNYMSDLIFNKETITDFILLPSLNSSSINSLKFGAYNKGDSPIKLVVYYIPID